MKKLIIIFIVLLVAVAAVGLWFWQRNTFSKGVLKLEILGPTQAAVGQELEYTVTYQNTGNVTLQQPDLVFNYPDNSIPSDGSSLREEITGDKLGDIYPGQEKSFSFKARLFGKDGDVQNAKASLSYYPKNLNARYESDTTLVTSLQETSLNFDYDLASSASPGKDLTFSLNYFSNLDFPLSNLGVQIAYPSDFQFEKSVPTATGQNQWNIPLLNKTEGGRIQITGLLSGQVNQQEVFDATLGIWLDDKFVPIKEITKGVQVSTPAIDVSQTVNGQTNYTANPGDLLHYQIFFRNLSDSPFTNLFLIVRLNGPAFDLSTIKAASGGQYNSGDNSIVWDSSSSPDLQFLDVGGQGSVDFWVNTKTGWQSSGQQNDFVLGDNVLISQVEQDFSIKMNSNLVISQKALFQDEAFGNTGANPPIAGQPTTYTIEWQAKNYYNDVKNVKVKATLPANVSLTGQFFPADQATNFSFDSASREIVWNVADMAAGTGVSNDAPTIYFQVSLTPTPDQKGNVAQIIGQAQISADDSWTGQSITGTDSAVDTTLPEDTNISNHSGIVQ